jgi:hypothetical protein
MESDDTGHLTVDQKKNLYNAFLELENAPLTKNVFIVSDALNWQHIDNDPLNADTLLTRQLAKFPYLKVYVITANHAVTTNRSDWYLEQHHGNLTYLAGLVATSSNDRGIHVAVDDLGKVAVTPADIR